MPNRKLDTYAADVKAWGTGHIVLFAAAAAAIGFVLGALLF